MVGGYLVSTYAVEGDKVSLILPPPPEEAKGARSGGASYLATTCCWVVGWGFGGSVCGDARCKCL